MFFIPTCYFCLLQVIKLPEDSVIPKKTKDGNLKIFYARYTFDGITFQAIIPKENFVSSDEEEEEFTSLRMKKQNGTINGHAKTPNRHAKTPKSKSKP